MKKSDAELGEAALRKGYVTFLQLKECREVQHKLEELGLSSKPLLEILTEKRYLKPAQAAELARDEGGTPPPPEAVPSAAPDPPEGYEAGERAIQEGLITFDQLRECLDMQSKIRSLGYDPKPLDEILVKKEFLTQEQLDALKRGRSAKAQRVPRRVEARLGEAALKRRLITREQLDACLAEQASAREKGRAPRKIGELLVDKGHLKAAQLDELVLIAAKAVAPFEIPGYEILGKLGVGGMGAVYKARQKSVGRLVAIKILFPKHVGDHEYLQRFLREAKVLARLNHPNIVSAIDSGEVHGTPYFVMEFVDGTSLSTLLEHKGRIPEADCIKLGIHVANALDHGHRNRLVHRDVKPHNVIITRDGLVKLCDYGVAKTSDSREAGLTMEGMAVGTPYYMAPEACTGREVDIRADIYSLGATLYHLSTGGPPFDSESPAEILTMHVKRPLDSPKTRYAGLSDEFTRVVVRMLAKVPAERYSSPREAAHELERLLKARQKRKTAVVQGIPVVQETGALRVRRPARSPLRSLRERRVSHSASFAAIFVALILAAAAVYIFLKDVEFPSTAGRPRPPHAPPPRAPVAPPPAPADPWKASHDAKVARLNELRQAVRPDPGVDEWLAPYDLMISCLGDFRGTRHEQFWRDEVARFEKEANDRADDLWDQVRRKAQGYIELGEIRTALEHLEAFPEHLRHAGRNLPTRAERERIELVGKIRAMVGVTLEEYQRKITGAAASGDFGAAWRLTLEATVAGGSGQTRDVRVELLAAHMRALRHPPVTASIVVRAREILRGVREDHAADAAFQAAVDQGIAAIEADHAAAIEAAARRLETEARGYEAELDAFLAARDFDRAAARAAALMADPELAAALLSSSGTEAIRALLANPHRQGRDAAELAARCEQTLSAPPTEAARPLFAAIWRLGHVEALCRQAYRAVLDPDADRAAKLASTLSHPTLRGVTRLRAKPSDREGLALEVIVIRGSSELGGTVQIYPRGPKSLSEDDLVKLARNAPGGPGDEFEIRAALLYGIAGQAREAALWAKRIPDSRLPAIDPLREYVAALREGP